MLHTFWICQLEPVRLSYTVITLVFFLFVFFSVAFKTIDFQMFTCLAPTVCKVSAEKA